MDASKANAKKADVKTPYPKKDGSKRTQTSKADAKSTDDKASEEVRVDSKKDTKATQVDVDDLELRLLACVWFSVDIPTTYAVSDSWLSTLPRDSLHQFLHAIMRNKYDLQFKLSEFKRAHSNCSISASSDQNYPDKK